MTRSDVIAAVRAAFPANWNRALELLDTYGVEPHERERERVQLAVIALAGGSEEKLRAHVAAAKTDYRDVLQWAESPVPATQSIAAESAASSLLIVETLAAADPLAQWRWKLGDAAKVVALSRSGDAFVEQPNGTIEWLDTGAGDVSTVADSREAFARLLEDPQGSEELLLTPVVESFVRLHGPFPAGTCLGFTQLPVLGGAYTVDNRFCVSAVEHFGVTGDLHRQIRDLPDGAKVQLK